MATLKNDYGGDKPWRERMDQLTELHPRRTSPTMQVGKENDHGDEPWRSIKKIKTRIRIKIKKP